MSLEAVEGAFGSEFDYAQLVKLYGVDPDGVHRYSPPSCIGTETTVITGNPDRAHISTSYVERQNLTMDERAPFHTANERVLEENRKPRPHG